MENIKVLFLDFDGVLNNRKTAIAFDGYPWNLEEDFYKFDHTAIALIQKVCEKTGCKIVISSTWRRNTSMELIREKMKLPVIGRTPVEGEQGLPMSATRGMQIDDWLKRHPECIKYAIVDDDIFDIHQKKNLVNTSQEDGLSYENYEHLLRLLSDET